LNVRGSGGSFITAYTRSASSLFAMI